MRAGGLTPWQLQAAWSAVCGGGLIAYPTEAVFGLGCDPDNGAAVMALLRLKRRSWRLGLILIAATPAQLAPYLYFPSGTMGRRIRASWPGPVTWVLPARPGVPYWLRGAHRGLAVRVSAHRSVQQLCARTGPLVSTSANPSGAVAARDAHRVRCYFGPRLAYILPVATGGLAAPSEIRDGLSGAILRPAPDGIGSAPIQDGIGSAPIQDGISAPAAGAIQRRGISSVPAARYGGPYQGPTAGN